MIDIINGIQNIMIFPNPAGNELFIEYTTIANVMMFLFLYLI
ncbi:MAG: hypothetical protein R2831_04725 [Chitinophagaceae bacterium]